MFPDHTLADHEETTPAAGGRTPAAADDDTAIRELIERWVRAVDAGDLSGTVADHADDVVMFDVPPPAEGVRGLDTYRAAWPEFLQWQAQGARFELTSLEVTAGEDVAFAHALLRCGTSEELARDPRNRLRLTFGLRRQDGRWVIAHEHHSFPTVEGDSDSGSAEVRALHERWFLDTAAGDLDALMAPIADDVVSYEHEQPLQYVGADSVRQVCRRGLEASSERVTWDVPDLKIVARGDLAVGWGLNRVRIERSDGSAVEHWSRGTRVFQRIDGSWQMIHQHVSYPYDPESGIARTDLRP